MAQVTMRQMLEAGVHFGHQTRYWNPKMAPYIFGARGKIHIINLEKTLPLFTDAMNFLSGLAQKRGTVLFVGTKRSAREPLAEEAARAGMPFVTSRWLGGMLTNFRTVKQSVSRLKELEAMAAESNWEGRAKKEVVRMERERKHLSQNLQGIKDMNGLPDILFVVDSNKEAIAVEEARKLGIAVVAVTPLFVAETPRQPGRFDLTGAITSTAGVAALVYGFIRAASYGWGDRVGLAAFAAAAVLLAVFVRTETRAPQPITPLRLFADASRSGSFAARLLLVGGMFGMFFFLTQFLQDVLGFSPLRAGLAFLPMTLLLFAVSRGVPRLMPVFGPWRLMIAGMLPVVAGMALLSQVSPATSYWTGIFPPMVLLGAGMGVVFVPLTTASLAGVRPQDSGAASSMVNVMQQLGGSLGLAVLVAVFGTASRTALAHPVAGQSAAVFQQHVLAHGMAAAFGLAAIFDVAALLIIAILLRGRPAGPALAPAETDELDLVPVPDIE